MVDVLVLLVVRVPQVQVVEETVALPQLQLVENPEVVDILVVTQRLIPKVRRDSQLLVDTVAVVLVVLVVQVPQVQVDVPVVLVVQVSQLQVDVPVCAGLAGFSGAVVEETVLPQLQNRCGIVANPEVVDIPVGTQRQIPMIRLFSKSQRFPSFSSTWWSMSLLYWSCEFHRCRV